MDIDELKKHLKNKKIKELKEENNYDFSKILSRFLIVVILTLTTLIVLRSNSKLKTSFYKNVLEKNITFAKINKVFKNKFGSPIPFSDKLEKEELKTVFNEKLKYNSKSKYLDGVKLKVDNNYLVPNLEDGVVVFIGKKDNYGNTVIVEGVDGVDVWYGNVKNTSLKPYDYVKKGSLIGETVNNNLYLIYKKDGKVLNYEDYL